MKRYKHNHRGLALRLLAWCSTGLAIGAIIGSQPAAAKAQRGTSLAIERVQRAFGLRAATLSNVQLLRKTPDQLEVGLLLAGQALRLDLYKHSVRANGYRILVEQADGSMAFAVPGPVSTYRGVVRGQEGSVVAASLDGDELRARIILSGGEEWWLERVAARLPDAAANTYVLYQSDDVEPDLGSCQTALATETAGAEPASNESEPQTAEAGACGTGLCVAEVAADADYEFFLHAGSVEAVETHINAIINAVNIQYERDVQIRQAITTIVVRTAETDPYSSTDARALLDEFRTHWLNNHGDIQRDAAQLFSGKEFDGGTIGIAWLGSVCGSYGFSAVEGNFSSNFGSLTDLSAHELGHSWSAGHCSCSGYTMNPYITSSNVFNPDLTIPAVISFRDSRTCLAGGTDCESDVDCDDSQFCNGVERCSAGACESPGDPCPGEDCDEIMDVCVPRVCDGDGVCNGQETCDNCPSDCFRGTGGVCGNGVCEIGAAEDCVNCPSDCNGVQNGKPARRFCCGSSGHNPVGCDDGRCGDATSCTDSQGTPSCCGDQVCEGVEDRLNCPVDCAVPCAGDGDCSTDDACQVAWCDAGFCTLESVDCDDGNACTTDACSDGVCQCVALVCDDGNHCSIDTCDPASGCRNEFPACGVADGCCAPECTKSTDVDCSCAQKNDACFFNTDCCSGICKPNGRCR